MATRLKTRLSAGAALVTGIGMMGVATALPAQAETTLTYTCAVGETSDSVATTIDTNAPQTVGPGETLTVDSVTANIGIPFAEGDETATGSIEVSVPLTAPVRTGDEIVGEVATSLTSGTLTQVTETEGIARVALSSSQAQSIAVPTSAAGHAFEVLAPQTFTATISGTLNGNEISTSAECTYTEGDRVIDAVTVTSPEMDEGPDDAEDTAEVHDPADEQPPAADAPAADASGDEPAVPQVVQTDGLTPQMLPQEDHTLGYALGGLLLAGAGAGTILVVRRRSTQH